MADQSVETLPAVRELSITRVEDFLPLMTVAQAVQRKNMVNEFISSVLRESTDPKAADGDYGTIPGAGTKKVLLKPGAEKLCSIFGLAPTYDTAMEIEDWTGVDHGGEPLFYYKYRCQLSRSGKFMGEAIGSANSWESKHRYRWLRADQLPEKTNLAALHSRGGRQTLFAYEFAIDKAETSGQYGKPAEYWQAFKDAATAGTARRVNKPFKNGKEGWGWEMDVDTAMYRIPNPDAPDLVNTLQKMAQKRALVAAVLVVTNCSDSFTQDLEDLEPQQVDNMPKPAAPVQRPIPDSLLDAFAEMRADNPDGGKVGMDAIAGIEKRMFQKAGEAGKAAHAAMLVEYRKRVPKGKDSIGSLKELLLDLWAAFEKLEASEVPSEVA